MRTPASKPSLLDWALRYINLGWSVIPLVKGEKIPLTKHGLLEATTDEDMTVAWWTAQPNANIGLRTGEAFDVIDVDGAVGLAALSERAGPEWRHSGPVSLTGKGWHYLIKPTGSRNGASLLPKVDFRGVRGYIVAPPSVHPNGGRYQWDPTRDWYTDLPDAPDWIKPLLSPWKPPAPPITTDIFDPAMSVLKFAEDNGWTLHTASRGYKVTCMLGTHEDSTPSFHIYTDTNSWYCWGCLEGGDLAWLRGLLKRK